MDLKNVKVEPVGQTCGAAVHVDKETLFQPDFPAFCLDLLAKYAALVFPKVNLTDEEQLKFTDSLGDRYNFTNNVPGGNASMQDVYTITLDKSVNNEPEYVLGSFYWHQDGIVSPNPPSPITLLSCKVPPDPGKGGQTEFSNTYAAWEALPEETKQQLEGMRVMHSLTAACREVSSPEDIREDLRDLAFEHPLVWTRKDGRKSLLIGLTADYIVGMPKVHGRAVLNRLNEWASRPEFCCRHEWSPGDFAMWDNTGTLHRAVPYDLESRRRMHRTSVGGFEAVA
jgi:alpha-ketoglutarate-dependent taurine dioxygenase